MESKKSRGFPRLWQLTICFLLFLGAIFFRSLSGRTWNPSGGAETLRELAGKVGETLAQSPIVEAFAEGFREGSHGNAVEAAGASGTAAASKVKFSEKAAKVTDDASEKAEKATDKASGKTVDMTDKVSEKAAKATDEALERTEKAATTGTTTAAETAAPPETSLPLLTKRAGGRT